MCRKNDKIFIKQDEEESHRRSNTAGASYNLINSIVGSGVIGKLIIISRSFVSYSVSLCFIGMSYAFRQSGYLAGIGLLGLVALLTGKKTM